MEEPAQTEVTGDRRTIRIYIGGVSASVTAADIEKTFASLGRVDGVELVRTDGRNFAFMDFEPHSDKTLAKLFSAYNGCTWKGGKLKLEKAKEHYLARLKREWADDTTINSALPSDPDVDKDVGNSKLERLKQEDMQLRIFFPKLRKVKSLPFKGTGKHKYSFQRIDVPSLPIHFCDCEEHLEQSERASQTYFSAMKTGVNLDKEIRIMNSVMNKLLEKHNYEVAADKSTELATSEDISDPSIYDIHSEETEAAFEVDEDNLVTNIGMGRRDDALMQLNRKEILSSNQEPRFCNSQDEVTQNRANSRKRQKMGPAEASEATANKRAKPVSSGKITEDEFADILPRNTNSEGRSEEAGIFEEPLLRKSQSEPSTNTAQTIKSHSWLQKSSWRDLIGVAGNTPFSVSNVLPDISSVSPKLLKSNGLAIDRTVETKKRTKRMKAQPDKEKSEISPVMHDGTLKGEELLSANWEPTFGTVHSSQIGLAQNKATSKKRKKISPTDASEAAANKAADPLTLGKIMGDEFTTMLPQNVSSEGDSQEPEITAKPLPKSDPNMSTAQSTKCHSWLQKSSWRDLVGETGNTSFSISNVLPGVNSVSSELPKYNDLPVGISLVTKKTPKKANAPLPIKETSEASTVVHGALLEKAVVPGNDEISGKADRTQTNPCGIEHKEPPKNGDHVERRTLAKVSIDEDCTFMRTAESLKELAKTKAALSRYYRKKKKDENDASNNLRGTLHRKR